MGEFTQALEDLRQGRSGTDAVNTLFRVAYEELKQLARARLRRSAPMTALDTTAVVHEAYLRFLKAHNIAIEDRGHFMVYAAKAMRSVVVDNVRRRSARRRDAGVLVTLGTDVDTPAARDDELLRIDDALSALQRVDPELVRIVEMRYFAGLTVDEVAEALITSPRSVARQWSKARVVLLDAMSR